MSSDMAQTMSLNMTGSKNVTRFGHVIEAHGSNVFWDHVAIFEPPSGDRFEITAAPVSHRAGRFTIGIVPEILGAGTIASSSWSGWHVASDGELWCHQQGRGGSLPSFFRSLEAGEALRLQFHRPQMILCAAIADEPLTALPFRGGEEAQSTSWCPCFCIDQAGMACSVSVKPARTSSIAHLVPATLGISMWEHVDFTDAVVMCGASRWPVHRCVLSVGSPVFKAMLKGGLREASEATVRIDDAPVAAVEALLHYIYAGSIDRADSGIDVLELMPLAHRFELPVLLELCMEKCLKELSVDNAAKTVERLQLYSEESACASEALEKVKQKLTRDDALLCAVLKHVRAPEQDARHVQGPIFDSQEL